MLICLYIINKIYSEIHKPIKNKSSGDYRCVELCSCLVEILGSDINDFIKKFKEIGNDFEKILQFKTFT